MPAFFNSVPEVGLESVTRNRVLAGSLPSMGCRPMIFSGLPSSFPQRGYGYQPSGKRVFERRRGLRLRELHLP